ncbi:DUF58 domain-containing protein [Cellvibrio zantedeschiae]|uniref:DUF58 domain-containing protein n=1 Tax=Cellvibrio zantedeschiae TaxID=1237077 RepID=A0ABQ3B192_9GAMM|nr:DUF58 domain-containing protein [Cellvibrio zantedeschiae]
MLQHRTIYVFPSKQGAAFLVLILLIWILGTNYQNNLILGLSFFLTSVMLVSVIHAFKNLLGLIFIPDAIQHAAVGDVASFDIEISSSYLNDHHGLLLRVNADFDPIRADVIAGKVTQVRLNLPARHRGWLKLPRIVLKSYFPFGLIRAWAYIDLHHRALIFPKPIACDQPPLGPGQGDEGIYVSMQRGDEFQGFQNYQPGSPLSQIAWKQYARGAGLHLKDYRALQSEHYWLDWQALNTHDTELALSNLTYWVNYFADSNIEFGLRLPNQTIERGTGDVHRLNALTALALFGWVQED